MKRLIAVICGLMLATSPLAFAQDKAKDTEKKSAPAAEKPKKEPTEKQKAQQARMKDCNARAAERKLEGEARKKFMSSCLKGEEVASAPDKKTAQQERMKACNKQASDKKLKGDERKTFMSECLKG